jgi:hypothetical protein
MSPAEITGRLGGLLDAFETHRNYIDRAREQGASGRFSAAVVEKVVLELEIKCSAITEEVGPMVPTLAQAVADLVAQAGTISAGKGGVDDRVQEYELRLMIGQISQEDFDREVGELQSQQAEANRQIEALEQEAATYRAGLERWEALSARAGRPVKAGPTPAPAPVAAPQPVLENVVEVNAPAPVPAAQPQEEQEVAEVDVDLAPADDVLVGETQVPLEAVDLGGLFDDAPLAAVQAAPEEEVSVSLTPEPVEEPAVEVDVSPYVPAPADVDVDVAVEEAEPVSARSGDEPRRHALLVLNENTEDEQAYTFEEDEMWIGRSKDCQIQLKADPKVSRQHCRLYRRGNHFFIEDNGSTNSTLVNRELITERRLYGGEEISVGESQFRFRIID